VADWEHDDGWEDGEAASPTDPGGVEGVRILGAAPGGPRFPLGGDDATWSASAEDREGSEEGGDTSGSMRLPHWTEPPTGEVPRFLPEDDTSDDLESWSTLGGSTPRFRTGAGAWAGSDLQAGELEHDDSTAVGALAEHPEDEHDDLAPPPRTRRERRERRARGAGGRGGTAVADGTTREAPPERGALEGPPRPGPLPRERPVPTGQRVITGLVLAGIALLCFLAGRPVTTVLVTVIVGVAAFELYEALRRAGYHTATVIGLLGCVAIVPIAYDQGERAFPMMIVLVVAFTMLWYLVEVVRVPRLLRRLRWAPAGPQGRHRVPGGRRDLRRGLRHRRLVRGIAPWPHPARAGLTQQDGRRARRGHDRGARARRLRRGHVAPVGRRWRR
jgi:hypothetical protein